MNNVDDLAETLMNQYLVLRRKKIPNYRFSKKKKFGKFKELAEYLVESNISSPAEYMKFAVDLYQPNPYVNMVCSYKTVKAFLESEPNDLVSDEPEYENNLLKGRTDLGYDAKEAVRQMASQISPITCYCFLRENGSKASALKYYGDAKEAWLLTSEQSKDRYKKVFPKATKTL